MTAHFVSLSRSGSGGCGTLFLIVTMLICCTSGFVCSAFTCLFYEGSEGFRSGSFSDRWDNFTVLAFPARRNTVMAYQSLGRSIFSVYDCSEFFGVPRRIFHEVDATYGPQVFNTDWMYKGRPVLALSRQYGAAWQEIGFLAIDGKSCKRLETISYDYVEFRRLDSAHPVLIAHARPYESTDVPMIYRWDEANGRLEDDSYAHPRYYRELTDGLLKEWGVSGVREFICSGGAQLESRLSILRLFSRYGEVEQVNEYLNVINSMVSKENQYLLPFLSDFKEDFARRTEMSRN